MTKITIPPLPPSERQVSVGPCGGSAPHGRTFTLYTADQMIDDRKACIEAALAAAVEICNDRGAWGCAAEIRALGSQL